MINFLRMNAIKGTYRLYKGDSLLRHFVPRGHGKVPHIESVEEIADLDIFRAGICHRCLLRVPSVRWSNLPEHSAFLYHFGWYWKQQMLAYGIDWFMPFLRDQCPGDLAALLEIDPCEAQGRLSEYEREHNLSIYAFDHPPGILGSLRPGMGDMYALSQRMRAVRKSVENDVERRLRADFGFPARGKTLNNETVLYLICRSIFQPHTVERHARPDALRGLTLDIFVPEVRIAVEYQGQQHFEPADHLGGEKHFRMTVRRDRRKAKLCRENDITLVYFDVSDKLTEEHVRNKISQQSAAPLPSAPQTGPSDGAR